MEILENFNFPEIIINKTMTYLTHPVADLFNGYSGCLQQKIIDVPELSFHIFYFFTRRYPILYEYLKLPTKQIYDIF